MKHFSAHSDSRMSLSSTAASSMDLQTAGLSTLPGVPSSGSLWRPAYRCSAFPYNEPPNHIRLICLHIALVHIIPLRRSSNTGVLCSPLKASAHARPPVDSSMTVQLISIWCTQVTDAGLRQLRPHYGLTHLDLSHCHQITDDGLKQLRGMHILSSGTHRQLVSLCSDGCLATHEKAARYPSL